LYGKLKIIRNGNRIDAGRKSESRINVGIEN
jgi:hypothetical protein